MPENVIATTATEAAAKPKDDFKIEAHEVLENNASEKTASAQETDETKKVAASEEAKTEEPINEAEETEEEADARLASEKTAEAKGNKKGGFQRKVDKLTKQKAEAQREVEFWRAKALEAQKPAGETKAAEQKPNVDLSKKPVADNFEKHEEFIEALTDWKLDQKLAAEKANARETELKGEKQKMLKTHGDRVNEFKKATPDFAEKMEDIADKRISGAIQSSILESEFGPNIMYEFAKNPAELERLHSLSPEAQARAIGRMEAKFESSSEVKKTETAAEKVPDKKVTSAPKPINPVNSKAGVAKTIRDDLPYDEWVKVRRSDLRNG